jgi:hypothetical protein
MTIEKQDGGKGLVLGGRSEEGTHFRGFKFGRVPLRMEDYVALDPVNVDLFGTKAIVASANYRSDLL